MSTTKGKGKRMRASGKASRPPSTVTPRFRRQPLPWGDRKPVAGALEFGTTLIEPSLGRSELVWMLHTLSWEWVSFSNYLGALSYPEPPGTEAEAARAVARALCAALDSFLLGSATDLASLEGAALTVLRRHVKAQKQKPSGPWGAPLGTAPVDDGAITIPTLTDQNVWRSGGDPFRACEKRDPDGRLATLNGIRTGLARVLDRNPTAEHVSKWLLRGEAPPGVWGMSPAPFDQLREFFRERGKDYRSLSSERVISVARRVLAGHRTSGLDEAARLDLAETIIRRSVALVVGKDAAKLLFDADRKRETRAILRGRTPG